MIAMKTLILFSIAIQLSPTIAQSNEDVLMKNIDDEHGNVRNEVESILNMEKLPNNPGCLKPILRNFRKILQYLVHFIRGKFAEDQMYKSLRDSGKLTTDQINEHFNYLNNTLHRFRDIRESLTIAKNTIRYIKHELRPEILKTHLEQEYNIEDELKMECDSLKGILDSTVQLTRRLLPANWRGMLWPRHSPIIRLKPTFQFANVEN